MHVGLGATTAINSLDIFRLSHMVFSLQLNDVFCSFECQANLPRNQIQISRCTDLGTRYQNCVMYLS